MYDVFLSFKNLDEFSTTKVDCTADAHKDTAFRL